MFSSTSLLCELGELLTTLRSVICIKGPTIQGNGIGQKLGQELQDGELQAHPGGMQCGGEQAQPSWAVAESAGSRGKKGKKLGVGSKSGLWHCPSLPPHTPSKVSLLLVIPRVTMPALCTAAPPFLGDFVRIPSHHLYCDPPLAWLEVGLEPPSPGLPPGDPGLNSA